MQQMFNSARLFNQTITFDTPLLQNTASMFFTANSFNNGDPVIISSPTKPLKLKTQNVTSMATMFRAASAFNQNISYDVALNTWNTALVSNMSNMLQDTFLFNNGESGFTDLLSGANILPNFCNYTSSSRTLNCTTVGANFTLAGLTTDDIIVIRQTGSTIFSSKIDNITPNTLTLNATTTTITSNITSGNITSIRKQVVGTSPLNWDTSGVTLMTSMFQNATVFNQNIGNWDVKKVTNLSTMFQGSSAINTVTFFNNGQLITSGLTGFPSPPAPPAVPMGWTFNVTPTSTGYRTNSRLTTGNKPGTLP
jgi:surface protein